MSQTASPASTALRRYALTGGIGSGKSTIASLFVEQGAFLIDADAISRSLMEPGEAALARSRSLASTCSTRTAASTAPPWRASCSMMSRRACA